MSERTKIFRCRIGRKLNFKTRLVAEKIGAAPGQIFRLLFRQMVNHRAMPFLSRADSPENETMRPARLRAGLWDEMNDAP